jgi:F420-non-reducing hydrogenase iron-sulfur subunit
MDASFPKLIIFYCTNLRLFKDGQKKEFERSHEGLTLRSLPCSGKLEAYHLLNALAAGADGVLVIGCAKNACQYLEGSMRSHKRLDYARHWLKSLDIEPERIDFVHLPPMSLDIMEKALEDFVARLKFPGSPSPISTIEIK